MELFRAVSHIKSVIVLLSATIFFMSTTLANDNEASETQKAQVALLGVFHFTNPGLDTVKTKQVNVLEPESQEYLVSFSNRIASGFKPTKVLVECARKSQQSMDKKFALYRKGNDDLGVNEIYQLGFRIAKAADAQLICYDEREIHWQAGDLTAYMKEHDHDAQARHDSGIQEITKLLQQMHSELSLEELLIEFNSEALDTLNKSLYLSTNDVGAETNYYGADATASWWHRNFRMYANIQKAAAPNERVLAIGGQGHTAILRDFLRDDRLREAHALTPYF